MTVIHGRSSQALSFVFLWLLGAIAVIVVLQTVESSLPLPLSDSVINTLGVLSSGCLLIGGYALTKYRESQRSRVDRLYTHGDPADVPEALSLLQSRDSRVRSVAIQFVADHSRTAPGKVLKHAQVDVETIVSRIAALLTDTTGAIDEHAAVTIKFFARDYPGAVLDHTVTLQQLLETNNSVVQVNVAIALGNLAAAFPDFSETYRSDLLALADDEDPEVRAGACIALVHVPGVEPHTMESFTDDSSPLVTNAVTAAQALANGDSSAVAPLFDGVTVPDSTPTTGQHVQSPPELDFTDIAGMESVTELLTEQVILPASGSRPYEKYETEPVTGVLLHGPPGTGKSHTAQCLAGELDWNLLEFNGSAPEHTGPGELSDLFEEARMNQPCLIVLDELDAITDSPSSHTTAGGTTQRVSQLLRALSTIDSDDDIVVVGTTNRPEAIDEAMLRTGRFDTKIQLPSPDGATRLAIFTHHMSVPVSQFDSERFVRETDGLVASDIVELARRSRINAARREHEHGVQGTVSNRDVFEAIAAMTDERDLTGEFVQRSPDLSFQDVVGNAAIKAQLREVVIEPLQSPEPHETYGIGIENGVLLYGPPGTGKTHLARCLAGELGCAFVSIRASDLVSKWIGEGAENVAALFREARASQPCIVFVDEIDALATDRAAQQTTSERQLVTQLLTELSACHDNEDAVVVVGATNRIDAIDPAMLRTGRFSETIEVGPPDAGTRTALFEHALDAPVQNVDFEQLSDMTTGFVASDIVNVCERAARTALRRAQAGNEPSSVTQDDLHNAIETVRTRTND